MDMNTIDDALKDLLTLNGAIASSLIDWQSGMQYLSHFGF